MTGGPSCCAGDGLDAQVRRDAAARPAAATTHPREHRRMIKAARKPNRLGAAQWRGAALRAEAARLSPGAGVRGNPRSVRYRASVTEGAPDCRGTLPMERRQRAGSEYMQSLSTFSSIVDSRILDRPADCARGCFRKALSIDRANIKRTRQTPKSPLPRDRPPSQKEARWTCH